MILLIFAQGFHLLLQDLNTNLVSANSGSAQQNKQTVNISHQRHCITHSATQTAESAHVRKPLAGLAQQIRNPSIGNGVYIDAAMAPFGGYSCECTVGYFDNAGTCINIDCCPDNTCGSDGACVDVAAPGTGFTCSCNSGYVSTDLVCVNELGCSNYPNYDLMRKYFFPR